MDRKNWLNQLAQIKAQGSIPVIAEIKPSSPNEGDLLKGRDIQQVIKQYEDGGAACISVVTGKWFGGHLSLLEAAAKTTALPLLRKDLIVNREQIKQSIDHGANAILLTKKILKESHLKKMIDHCLSLNVTPFIELSELKEIEDFQNHPEVIIGITNRDISRKETDVDSGLKSIELIESCRKKAGAIISASGIHSPQEAQRLYQAGFDGLLIGTALLKSDDPLAMVKRFTHAHQEMDKPA